MNKLKRCLSLMLCAVLACSALPLAACSSSNSKNITIRVEYPTSRSFGDQAVASFEDWFKDTYPDATLEMVPSSVTTINDTVKSEFLQGNAPDIFMTSDYDSFVNNDQLADITDIESVTLYRKSAIRDLERNGRVYALPFGGGKLFALCYNKTLFDQLGIDPPSSGEKMTDIIDRVTKAAEESDEMDIRPISSSLLYPTQSSLSVGSTLAEYTQRTTYLKWLTGYTNGDATFEDQAFQDYLDQIEDLIIEGDTIKSSDLTNTYSAATDDFLNGKSLMFMGDVNRCWDAFSEEHAYGKDDIAVMGIPVGMEGAGYVSFMDDMYLCVSKDYENQSDRKREIIDGVLNHIASGDDQTRSVFTFIGDYCSEYREGESIKLSDDPFFDQVNNAIQENSITQGVSNVSFSGVLGNAVMYWKRGQLDKVVEDENLKGKEAVTALLESYRTTGEDPFAKSTAPIGQSPVLMPCVSDEMRTQETILSDQVADMARSYCGADFALINAGCIRASMPEGPFSEQTINAMIPYVSYIAYIEVSGKTLRSAVENGLNVTPLHKSGKFCAISGLNVVARTKPEGYAQYESQLNAWKAENQGAYDAEVQDEMARIAEEICADDPTALNLELVSLTDDQGNPIQDDQTYTVAVSDYMLKGQDDYTMLGILSDLPDADRTIKLYNRQGELIEGTPEEMSAKLESSAETLSDSFITWVKEGNGLRDSTDGRIKIENLIYLQ